MGRLKKVAPSTVSRIYSQFIRIRQNTCNKHLRRFH
jgi:hypothetical protein